MTAIALQFPSGRNYRRGSATRLLLNLVNGLREAMAMRDHYVELDHKSDDELNALKLHRQDLPRVAQAR